MCHPGKVEWADAAVGFGAFYHRLFRDGGVEDAVAAMKAAAGDSNFQLVQGSGVQLAFRELMAAANDVEFDLAVSALESAVAGLDARQAPQKTAPRLTGEL